MSKTKSQIRYEDVFLHSTPVILLWGKRNRLFINGNSYHGHIDDIFRFIQAHFKYLSPEVEIISSLLFYFCPDYEGAASFIINEDYIILRYFEPTEDITNDLYNESTLDKLGIKFEIQSNDKFTTIILYKIGIDYEE